MSALEINNPFQFFTETSGENLEAGYIYIGTSNLNPETNPITVYWDAALTIPAAQPIRTIGGYPSRSGSAAKFFIDGTNYSITVRNSRMDLVYSSAENQILGTSSANVFYIAPETGAVATTVQAKLREVRSIKDFGGSLATALTGIGSTVMTLIINDAVAVTVDTVVPATLEIKVENGALITVSAGKKLTFNGPFSATRSKIFASTGTVLFGKGTTDALRPEWWGAVPDGVEDCNAAITKAIESIAHVDSEVQTLQFSSGNYYLLTPVITYFDAYSDNAALRFVGTSTPSNYNQKGTVISGAAAIQSMFVFRAAALTTPFFYSFECSNICFMSSGFGVTGPACALLSLGGGQASRPFVVKNCYFKGFTAAIKSDMTGSSLSTGIANVDIRNNFFISNTYALHGVGTGAFVGLSFCDNAAGTGGRILASLEGPYQITGNIFESNDDAITITGGLHFGEIVRNYYESNTGELANISATAPQSTITFGPNFLTSVSGTDVVYQGVEVNQPQDVAWAGVRTRATNISGMSKIRSQSLIYPVSLSQSIDLSLDPDSIQLNSNLNTSTLSQAQWSNAVGTAKWTPIAGAAVNIDTINGSGVPRVVSVDVVTNEWVVAAVLARRRVGTGALYINILNNAGSASIGTSNTNTNHVMTGIGEWFYVMAAVKVTAASTGSLQFSWNTESGTQIDVTSTYIYSAGAIGLNDPIAIVMPPIV